MNGLPEVVATRGDAQHSELELIVTADNPWFNGHFPGQPILPGVVQIGWAVHFAGTACAMHADVYALEQIKFRRPILPGARLTLRLTPIADQRKLKFEYRDAEHIYSSGTLDSGNSE